MPSYKAKQKTAAERNMPTIEKNLNDHYEYNQYGGKIKDGKLFVLYGGKWIDKADFDKLVPKPVVIENFTVNLNNCDGTQKYKNS